MALKLPCVLGTRPEAIKLAPVLKALRARPHQFSCRVCVTGQHREFLQPALRLFHICPDYDLKLMQPGQSLQHVAAGVVQGLEPILAQEKPDWVLVQGDTTTTLAAALAATYAHVPVAHVEAGLRSRNLRQPFPEEINRRLTDQLAQLHFAPTETARQNLIAEGIPPTRIFVTGNTVVDALREVVARPFDFARSSLATLPLDSRRLVLVTAHRRESFGQPLRHICRAVRQLAERYRERIHIVFLVHLNPNVRESVHNLLSGRGNISLLDPLPYDALLYLLKRSALVLTDSGGLQEETPVLGVPVLVLRQLTERPEGVAAGSARIVGTDPEAIVAAAAQLLDHPAAREQMARVASPYGDGQAAPRILAALLESSP